MSGALASPRAPGAARSPWGLFAPSCKGCESVFSTETQGIFQIGDRTVSLYAHVKATRTVSPPRPFTSATPPPRLHRSRPCRFVFSYACFLHLFWSKSPRWQGQSAHEASIFTHFLPRKIPSFFHFLAKTRNRKNRRKSSKNVRKVQKQKSRPQTQKKAAPPQKARNDRKKAQGRAKKHGEAIASSPLSAFCNRTPKSRQKYGKSVPLAVGSSVKPRIRRKKVPNALSRGERAPKSLTARPNRHQVPKGAPKCAKTAGGKKRRRSTLFHVKHKNRSARAGASRAAGVSRAAGASRVVRKSRG